MLDKAIVISYFLGVILYWYWHTVFHWNNYFSVHTLIILHISAYKLFLTLLRSFWFFSLLKLGQCINECKCFKFHCEIRWVFWLLLLSLKDSALRSMLGQETWKWEVENKEKLGKKGGAGGIPKGRVGGIPRGWHGVLGNGQRGGTHSQGWWCPWGPDIPALCSI